MFKTMSYICVLFSMLIAFGHQMVIHHHHHHDYDAVHQGDETDDDSDHDPGHNIFSFGELDHSYIHHQTHHVFTPPLCISLATLFNIKTEENTNQVCPVAEDHPPSDSPPLDRYLLRGPPVC